MFSFFHRTPVINVDCFTANNDAYKFTPIVKAAKAKPEWYDQVLKTQPSNTPWPQYKVDEKGGIDFNWHMSLRTVKHCPGFHELYSKGFILENWCDLAVNVTESSIAFHYSNGKSPIVHSNDQTAPGFSNYYILKLNSPWLIQTKENVPFIALGAQWSLEGFNFHTLPGIVNFHYQTGSNAFITVEMGKPYMFHLPMGKPLMHFIPLSDKKIKIHNHIITEAELTTKSYNVTGTSMGWRRTISLVNRNDKREKKCPFGFGD